jgi:hypothetical protein
VYRDLTSAEKADLFMRIGAVVWFFQYLEDVLVTFLVMKIGYERRRAGTPFSPEEAEEFLADRRRNLTFGPLVDSCVAKDVIRKEWVDRFSNLKNERHWLIHRSIVENADHDMHHEQKRPALLARVGAIRAETMALCRLVDDALSAWANDHGVDVEEAERIAERTVRTWRGEA